MTALCGGGPSGLKAGSPEAAYVTGSEIATLIAGVFDVPAWIAIAAYAAAQSFTLDALCATDPPPMPSFTLVDITTILGTTPFLGTDSYAKLNDLVAIAAWYTFCRCTAVTTPTAPAAPTYPSGAPVTQPGQLVPQNQSPCWNVTEGINSWGFGTVPLHSMPNGSLPGQCTQQGDVVWKACLPATAMQFTVDVLADGTTNGNVKIEWRFFNSSGLEGVTDSANWAPGTFGNKTVVITPPSDWVSMQVQAINDAAGNNTARITSSLWCAGTTPTTPQSDCCPPDPTLSARVEQLLQAVEAIYLAMPLQLTSLSEGTVHSGLSTSGHFTPAAATIGIKVAFTAGTAQGEAAGDPLTVFDAGWITTSAVEGNYKSRRIEHSPELIIFDPLVDQVHYTLGPGVVATITELSRGP